MENRLFQQDKVNKNLKNKLMNLQLVKGNFEKQEAYDLILKLFQVKINYHESKIEKDSNEEDIKSREEKIKRIQNQLSELKNLIDSNVNTVEINASIEVKYN
jgi:hypothetical protein